MLSIYRRKKKSVVIHKISYNLFWRVLTYKQRIWKQLGYREIVWITVNDKTKDQKDLTQSELKKRASISVFVDVISAWESVF